MMIAGAAATARAQSTAAKATVDQLAWIAGPWTGTVGERSVDIHFMPPAAASMVGMYRSIQQNKPALYELLAIEQAGDGVVLRIKHVAPGPGLVSREAKDEAAENTLVSLEGRTATFEGGAPASPVRITYKSPDADTLTIVVARTRDGKPVSTEFKYRRLRP